MSAGRSAAGIHVESLDDMAAALYLVRFLEEVSDSPEVLWAAALALLARAGDEAAEARYGRFRHYPRGQLRQLRSDVAHALRLARFAVALQEAESERGRALDEELRLAAAEAGRRRRRAQTLPAERARLANRRGRGSSSSPA